MLVEIDKVFTTFIYVKYFNIQHYIYNRKKSIHTL